MPPSFAPSPTTFSPTVFGSTDPKAKSNSSNSNSQIGFIVGIAVGGFAILVLLMLSYWFFIHKDGSETSASKAEMELHESKDIGESVPAPESSSFSLTKNPLYNVKRESSIAAPSHLSANTNTNSYATVPAADGSRTILESKSKSMKGTSADPHKPSEKEPVMYLPTPNVKPSGHRIRIRPDLNSTPVHLVVPPTPLLVTKVILHDEREWGKVHSSHFPPNFETCNIMTDGWTLLKDMSPDLPEPVVFWQRGSSTSALQV